MTRRTSIIEQVGAFFAAKGGPMTADEYKQAEDAPIRFQLIKRNIGSWSRLLNMVGDLGQYGDVEVTVETPVVTTVETPVPVEKIEEPVEQKKPVKG